MKARMSLAAHKPHFAILVALFLTHIPADPSRAQQTGVPFDSTWAGYNTETLVGTQQYFLSSATLADVDNDLAPDVIASKFGSDIGLSRGFVVLKNAGDGTFGLPPAHYSAPLASQHLAVADLNGDGLNDVVVSNTGSNNQGNSIGVYFNQGGGTFGAPTSYTVGLGPAGIAAGDFNGDGRTDLAVANYRGGVGNTISVLLNTGGGVFAPAVAYPAGDAPFAVTAARINSDSAVDLVVANGWVNGGASINVLLNSSTGTFPNRTEYVANGRATVPSLKAIDVDHDGDTDVLFPFFDFNTGAVINLYRNQGSGTLTAERIQMHPFTVITDVDAADITGDGWEDIVAASTSARTTDGYEVALNDRSGHFSYSYLKPAGENTAAVMLGDVDHDGRVDILTADSYSMQITVHKNYGGGLFPLPHLSDLGGSQTVGSVDAADIDGDSRPDVVISASGRSGVDVPVKVLRNLGQGFFGPPVTYSIRGGGVQAKFRDLNGDGMPDLLFATGIGSPPYDFHYAMNLGNGTFGPIQTKAVGACGWYDVDAWDLNHDGMRDVVLTEPYGCQDIPTSARRIFICLNQGGGTFADPIIKLVGPHPMPIAAGDFDHDNNLDLVSGVSGGVIEVYFGIGNGDVQPPLQIPIADRGGAEDLAVADFNNDGNLDIASDNYLDFGTYTTSIVYGNGNRTFRPALVLPSPQSPDLANVSGITVGDMDHDGDPDLMVANYASHGLSLYQNDGTTFRYLPFRAGVFWGIYSPFYADFDGDGIGDVVAVGEVPPSGLTSTLLFLKGTNPGASAVSQEDASILSVLGQNHPNPFSGSTSIQYRVTTLGMTTLRIFDVQGRQVASLVRGLLSPGIYSVDWDASGRGSGVYYCRLTTAGHSESRRMLLVR